MGKKLLLTALACMFVNMLYGDVSIPDGAWSKLRDLQVHVDKAPAGGTSWDYTFEFIEKRLPLYVYQQDRRISEMEKAVAGKDNEVAEKVFEKEKELYAEIAKKDAEIDEANKKAETRMYLVIGLGIICSFLLGLYAWTVKVRMPAAVKASESTELIEIK